MPRVGNLLAGRNRVTWSPHIQARPTPQMWLRRKFRNPFIHSDAGIGASLTGGAYLEATVSADPQADLAALSAALSAGALVPIVLTAGPFAAPAAETVSLSGGIYFQSIVVGGTPSDAAAQSVTLTTGAYVNVIVELIGIVANSGTLSASLSGGAYYLP